MRAYDTTDRGRLRGGRKTSATLRTGITWKMGHCRQSINHIREVLNAKSRSYLVTRTVQICWSKVPEKGEGLRRGPHAEGPGATTARMGTAVTLRAEGATTAG